MGAYYNENDPKTAAWLKELIRQGLIADGEVDTRSIVDVRPADLAGFAQCHFFAGIGGWSYALRLAGWDDARPVWTGSCPCQPWSMAGEGAGMNDPRHLWPTWSGLISQCGPATIFGEQVASQDGLFWIDLVCVDLEAAGYAFGAFDLAAAGVGAPHIRQRLWFVAHTEIVGPALWRSGAVQGQQKPAWPAEQPSRRSAISWLAIADDRGREIADVSVRPTRQGSPKAVERGAGFWSAADWIPCADGRWRPVEPGTFPLAHGLPARVGRLRGYGNAIVPAVAAEVIKAYREVLGEDLHGL